MALDHSLFVVFTCAQSVAVVIHSFIHSLHSALASGAVYCNLSCLSCLCVCGERSVGVRTLPYYSQRAQCLRLSERFFNHLFIQLLLFNSTQIMIVPKDLKLKSNNSIREGGKGMGEEKEGRMSGFFLSRPVDPKHNPCTCRMMLRCYSEWLESKF